MVHVHERERERERERETETDRDRERERERGVSTEKIRIISSMTSLPEKSRLTTLASEDTSTLDRTACVLLLSQTVFFWIGNSLYIASCVFSASTNNQ